MRRLGAVLGLGVLLGCNPIKLEEFPRPFACDHNGGDGGQQCEVGWSCGFDDRCFDHALDGGQLVAQWRCAAPGHCPPGWQCGQELESVRQCQQLDAGAPSPCTTDQGCQGGWRCAAGRRCFDPDDVDGGTSRACEPLDGGGAGGQCPNGFRCGELVDGARRCLQLDAGVASPCTSDQGCEGGWRCDTERQRCVLVTDVVLTGPGPVSALEGRLVSPLQSSPVPLLFAMTRLFDVPSWAFVGYRLDGAARTRGTLAAALYDGGVLVTAQSTDERAVLDAGRRQLFSHWFPLAPGDRAGEVTDLVISELGPAVRFRDGGTSLFFFPPERRDGGWAPDASVWTAPSQRLRPLDSFGSPQPQGLLLATTGPAADGGRQARVQLFGGPGQDVPGELVDVVAARDEVYALTTDGTFAWPLTAPDGGAPGGVARRSGPLPRFEVLAIAAGKLPLDDRLQLQLSVDRLDGGVGLVPLLPEPTGQLIIPQTADLGVDLCPRNGPPSRAVQVAFARDPQGMRVGAVARCEILADGGSFPISLHYDDRGGPGLDAQLIAGLEDPVPFAGRFVAQRSSAFVRAHAGASGRMWHAVDLAAGDFLSGVGLIGDLPLRAVVLDRQPETMVAFDEGEGPRTVLVSGGRIFSPDDGAGFVSQIAGGGNIVPIALVSNQPTWLVSSAGALNIGPETQGSPSLFATLPGGLSFAAPASAVARALEINGRLRQVLLVSSGDTVWAADVTDSASTLFGPRSTFEAVLVPTPGIRVRSLSVEGRDPRELSGYLTTNSQTLRFKTSDLVRWSLTPVAQPPTADVPLEVWTEGDRGRVGTMDGRVWSLPIMVELTQPFPADAGTAFDFARRCGQLFATSTRAGVFTVAPTDGGLPHWEAVSAVNTALGPAESLRLYESRAGSDQLHAVSLEGRVVEVAPSLQCP